ncbi:MAG: GNAT family protein, partial [Arthrobacter sp.]
MPDIRLPLRTQRLVLRRFEAGGVASEAAEALLELGFGELGFHRIDANLDARNTASAALCKRLGMRLESTQVDKWHYRGQWATEVVYALLDDEW